MDLDSRLRGMSGSGMAGEGCGPPPRALPVRHDFSPPLFAMAPRLICGRFSINQLKTFP
jgi:hypothetical protein